MSKELQNFKILLINLIFAGVRQALGVLSSPESCHLINQLVYSYLSVIQSLLNHRRSGLAAQTNHKTLVRT